MWLDRLSATFNSGKTKSYNWRKSQLEAVIKGMKELNDELCEAVNLDLGRSEFCSYITEIAMTLAAAQHDLKNLKEYIKPK